MYLRFHFAVKISSRSATAREGMCGQASEDEGLNCRVALDRGGRRPLGRIKVGLADDTQRAKMTVSMYAVFLPGRARGRRLCPAPVRLAECGE